MDIFITFVMQTQLLAIFGCMGILSFSILSPSIGFPQNVSNLQIDNTGDSHVYQVWQQKSNTTNLEGIFFKHYALQTSGQPNTTASQMEPFEITENVSNFNASHPQVVSYDNKVFVFWSNISSSDGNSHYSWVQSADYGNHFTNINSLGSGNVNQSDLIIKVNKESGKIFLSYFENGKASITVMAPPGLACRSPC
jgi:hypothetical protein